MLNLLERTIFPLAFVHPFLLVVANYIIYRAERNKGRIVLLTGISAALAFTGLFIIGICLIFRDGMAPGMIPSQGAEALLRSLPGALIGFAFFVGSHFLTPILKQVLENIDKRTGGAQ